ncbi:MAG: S8 family peptidase [Flavobacteriales bacterium]|nr:S8 family peptidase [Flavobacteriales bacterium]
MKKLDSLLLLLLVAYLGHAQEYYWTDNQQFNLDSDHSRLTIEFFDRIPQEVDSIAHPNLLKVYPSPVHNRVFLEFSSDLDENFDAASLGLPSTEIAGQSFGFTTDSGASIFLTRNIVARISPHPQAQYQFDLYMSQFNAQVINSAHGLLLIEVGDIGDVFTLANSMYESGVTEFGHPDFVAEIIKFDDPLYADQYYLNNSGQVVQGFNCNWDVDINAPEAWEYTLGSEDIIVAVVDDGLESHEDLLDSDGVSRVLTGYTAIWGEPGEDDDPDDWYYGEPFADLDTHGMNCAGLIAASHNEIGMKGVAPNVRLMPINIFQGFGLTLYELALGFVWAADHGADVISNSWGYSACEGPFDAIDFGIEYATTEGRDGKGCVMVFAVGNSGANCVAYPARHPDVIGVGALNGQSNITSYSQSGPEIDVVAPSANEVVPIACPEGISGGIVTIEREGLSGCLEGGYTTEFRGTSASCPLVAGVAALLLSVDPELMEGQVRNYITESSLDVGEPGFDTHAGYGLVRADAAIEACANPECTDLANYDQDLLIVYGDQTTELSESQSFLSGIEVQAGGMLVVSSDITLSFGPDAKITVQDGGVAVFSNATFTSHCDAMWQGMEVWDTEASGEGSLDIENCIIEHAHFGIVVGSRVEPNDAWQEFWPYLIWDYGGSMSVQLSAFKDCAVGVFLPNTVYGLPQDANNVIIASNDFFTSADGLIDTGYNTQTPLEYPNVNSIYYAPANSVGRGAYGVIAHGVRNVEFTGNTFENLEQGIRGINSYFDITDGCTFDNLQYGIHLNGSILNGIAIESADLRISECLFTNIHDPHPADIGDLFTLPWVDCPGGFGGCNTDFVMSNSAAIRIEGIPGLYIANNDFGIVDFPSSTQETGMYLSDCSSHIITNNRIRYHEVGVVDLDSDDFCWGMALIGREENDDAPNVFDNCNQNLITGFDNMHLLWRCNEHTIDEFSDPKLMQNSGILGNQGSEPESDSDATTGAGNEFLPATLAGYQKSILSEVILENSIYDTDYDDLLAYDCEISEDEFASLAGGFIYFHHGDQEQDNTYKPSAGIFGGSAVNIAALFVAFDNNSSCENPYMINGPDDNDVWQQWTTSAEIGTKIDDKIIELSVAKSEVDNFHNQTGAMLDAIYGGITDNYELKNFLINNSPLSREVLEAYMLRYNVPSEYFAEVFILNSVIDESLHDLYHTRVQDMPASIQDVLNTLYLVNPEVETITSLTRQLQDYRKIYKGVVISEFRELIRAADIAEATSLLENQRGIFPKQLLFELDLQAEDFAAAQARLDGISNQIEEVANWKLLKQAQLDRLQSGNPAPIELSLLTSLLDGGIGTEGASEALNCLSHYGIEYPMSIPVPKLESEPRNFEFFEVIDPRDFSVYPNPANRYVRIHSPQSDGHTYVVSIYSLDGQLVHTESFVSHKEDALISLPNLTAGLYSFEISDSRGASAKQGNVIIQQK